MSLPDTDRQLRRELGRLLRARRSTLDVASLRLDASTRRPGSARREEVAARAGVSLSWYTRLEQGRVDGVSRSVLESIAGVLGMDEVEQGHLLRLAGLAHDAAVTAPPAWIDEFLESWSPNPADVLDSAFDILAANPSYARFWDDFVDVPPDRRNLAWLLLRSPSARERMEEWAATAPALVATLRASAARYGTLERIGPMVAELRRDVPEFAEWWDASPRARFAPEDVTIHDPRVGTLALRIVHLMPSDAPGLTTVVQLPRDAKTAERLAELHAWPEREAGAVA